MGRLNNVAKSISSFYDLYKPEKAVMSISDMTLTASASTEPGALRWEGVIGFEGEMTGDGRLIEPNALNWDEAELPIPLRAVFEDTGGHEQAYDVGRILSIKREGGNITASGDFDAGSEYGVEAARLVKAGVKRGVSMDLDNVTYEIRIAAEIWEEYTGNAEAGTETDPETDEEGRVIVYEESPDSQIMVITDARIRATTLVSIPAFSSALIEFVEDDDATDQGQDQDEAAAAVVAEAAAVVEAAATEAPSLIASGIPVNPPASWFTDPQLTEPTALRVGEDGHVYGHIALWDTCHTAFRECVSPPESAVDYAYFRTGSVLTDDGTEVSVGQITMDTLHAGQDLSATATLSHYEDTGRAAADVAVGSDEFGIWVAGALRPTMTDENIRALRASPISGDWRRIGGNLELVAALAVNVPGFPVPRPAALVASGNMMSLVASGMLAPQKVIAPGTEGALSIEDLRYLKRIAARERETQKTLDAKANALALRVRAARLSRRVGKIRDSKPLTKV